MRRRAAALIFDWIRESCVDGGSVLRLVKSEKKLERKKVEVANIVAVSSQSASECVSFYRYCPYILCSYTTFLRVSHYHLRLQSTRTRLSSTFFLPLLNLNSLFTSFSTYFNFHGR